MEKRSILPPSLFLHTHSHPSHTRTHWADDLQTTLLLALFALPSHDACGSPF